jgi:hypothetical protein
MLKPLDKSKFLPETLVCGRLKKETPVGVSFPVILLAGGVAEAIEMATRIVIILVLPVVSAVAVSTAQVLSHFSFPHFPWE